MEDGRRERSDGADLVALQRAVPAAVQEDGGVQGGAADAADLEKVEAGSSGAVQPDAHALASSGEEHVAQKVEAGSLEAHKVEKVDAGSGEAHKVEKVEAGSGEEQVAQKEEDAAGTKRKLAITGFIDPYDSDYDDDDVYEYNSGDEVDDGNKESFIEKVAEKIREKGKAAYHKWGKYRCPYCTTKPIPKNGHYESLMSHARALATSGKDVKIRAEHAALLKAMGPI